MPELFPDENQRVSADLIFARRKGLPIAGFTPSTEKKSADTIEH